MNKETFVHKIPALLNIYLALHGITYVVKFKWKYKNFILFVLSTIFIIMNDINKLFLIIERIIELQSNRNYYMLLLIMILHYMLRIQFFLKRKNLRYLNWRMAKIFSTIVPHTVLRYRNALILVFIINDIYITSATILFLLAVKDSSHINSYHGQNCAYEFVKNKTSTTTLYSLSIFLETWGLIAPFFTVYFCCFCLALKHTINEYKEIFERQKNITFNSLNKICKEISNVTNSCNEALHNILVLLFTIQLVNVFYHTYSILVDKYMTEFMLLFRILYIIFYFIQFVAICLFASSTSTAGCELKRCIYKIEVETNERWKHLHLIFEINDRFVEFKLLDSLVLDKNLILAAFGSLVTYGIIIATFNLNSKI